MTTLNNKIIFATPTKVGKTNRIFCAKFKYVGSCFPTGKVFKRGAVEFLRKTLFLLYDREYIHNLQTVDDFLLHFARGMSLQSVPP